MKTVLLFSGVGYPAVGRCIYCGTTEEPLTKEHIIPRAIGGTVTLAKSSCLKCANITKGIEQECFAGTLKGFRIKTAYRVKRPNGADINIVHLDGRLEKRKSGSSDDPATLILPLFPKPSLLSAKPPAEIFTTWFKSFNEGAVSAHPPGTLVGGAVFRGNTFGRVFAKIAHSYAVAMLGIDAFEPYLPDYILGRSDEPMNKFVGCTDQIPLKGEGHFIDLHPYERVWNWMRPLTPYKQVIVVHLRLFAEYDTPSYAVVVGEPRERIKFTKS